MMNHDKKHDSLRNFFMIQLPRETRLTLLLAATEFCHVLDFVIMMPLGPTLITQLQINPSQFALLVSVYSFAAAASGLLIGLYADNFARKRLLQTTFIGFIIGTIACGISFHYSQLLIARAIAGAFGGVLNGVIFAIVADIIPYERRGKVTGIIMSAFSIVSVIGVPIGLSVALFFDSPQTPFLGIALFAIIIFLGISWDLPTLNQHLTQKRPDHNKTKPALKHYVNIFLIPKHLMCFALILFMSFGTFSIVPFISPYAVQNLGMAEADLRLIYLIGGAITVVMSQVIGRSCDRFGVGPVFYLVASLSMIPMVGYTHLTSIRLPVILLFTTLFMVFASGRFIPAMTLITSIPKPQHRGGFMALLSSTRSLSLACSSFFAGIYLQMDEAGRLIGYGNLGIFASALTLCALLQFYFLKKA